jgi:hypothetical protein
LSLEKEINLEKETESEEESNIENKFDIEKFERQDPWKRFRNVCDKSIISFLTYLIIDERKITEVLNITSEELLERLTYKNFTMKTPEDDSLLQLQKNHTHDEYTLEELRIYWKIVQHPAIIGYYLISDFMNTIFRYNELI